MRRLTENECVLKILNKKNGIYSSMKTSAICNEKGTKKICYMKGVVIQECMGGGQGGVQRVGFPGVRGRELRRVSSARFP